MTSCGKSWGPADLSGQPLGLPCQAVPTTVPSCILHHRAPSFLRPACGHPMGSAQGPIPITGARALPPPQPLPPWLQHIPGHRGLTPDGEDACEPLCQFRNECCL